MAGLAGGGALAVLAVLLATHGSNDPPRITGGSARETARAIVGSGSDTDGAGSSLPSIGSAAVATNTGLPSTVRGASSNGHATSPQPHGPAPKKLDHHRIAASGAQPGGLAVEVSTAQPSSGFFSIDAKPYADIFVDGSPFGQTPLVHKPLPAGKHHLKAVRADGATKTYDVTVPANGTATAIHVAW